MVWSAERQGDNGELVKEVRGGEGETRATEERGGNSKTGRATGIALLRTEWDRVQISN